MTMMHLFLRPCWTVAPPTDQGPQALSVIGRVASRGQKDAAGAPDLPPISSDAHRHLQGAVKQPSDGKRPSRRRTNAQTRKRRVCLYRRKSGFATNKTRFHAQNMAAEPEAVLPDL